MLIVGNGRLITRNQLTPYLENGAVAIENGKIVDFGSTQDIKVKYEGAEFIDAKGKVIMPGLINTHMHIYSAFARGMMLDGPTSKNFSQILENLWWRLDKKLTLEDTKYSAYTTYIDCIKNGVTTVYDHHASPFAIRDSLFTIGEVADELGIRTSLCYEVSDRDGKNTIEEGIRENVEFIKHASKRNDNMQKGLFGLHASFTLSDATLNKCREEMSGLDAGYHVHTAEGIDDLYDSLQNHGKRVVERLHGFDILGDKTIAVHCIHVNSREMDILKATDTMVVHNPESNMGNAVGCSPVLSMFDKGILLGLGTDGYTSDMIESYKVGNIIHKHNLCDPSVAWGEIPTMLFDNNREIMNRHFNVEAGVIKEGAVGDVIIVDYNPLTPMNENNINSHVMFGMNGTAVNTTIINGKVLMKDRQLLNVDEAEIFRQSREISQKLWDRI
jgi:putative selenium metabolism protein SsnA